MPDQTPHTARQLVRRATSRRGILVGLGAAIATPAIIATTGGGAAAAPQTGAADHVSTTPECLSDLVAMGW